MKEIPMPLIKANQLGIVVFIVLALLLQQPVFIYLLWAVQAIAFIAGQKGNLFVIAAKPLLRSKLVDAETQALELARFNQSIAVGLLTVSSALLLLGWLVAGYIAAGFVLVAAGAAVLGYCVGCTIYFQYKKWKALRAT
ncbi:DUF4395 domain-containing protein [Paenibacillaceae bacterium]|nr:DUF4395 domain-containing protein [Paenibacillaceae bacterium]